MKRAVLLVLVVSLVVPVFAQKKKKSELPMQVVAAQFVYITSMHGDMYNPNTTVVERQAMSRLENEVRAWGRYKVVYRPEEAQLMLIVKAESYASPRVSTPPIDPTDTNARIGIGNIPIGPGTRADPRTDPTAVGIGTGVDVSNNGNDMLIVSLNPQEPAIDAPFVWRRSAHNGLQGKKPVLFEEFRKAVDETEKQNAKP